MMLIAKQTRFPLGVHVQPLEVFLALSLGAVIASLLILVHGQFSQGRLEIHPESHGMVATAREPIRVTFQLRNRGRGPLRLLGASAG